MFAIVLIRKTQSTLYGYPQTVVFATVGDAEQVIHMECLDEAFDSVKIISLGAEVKREKVSE